MRNVLVPAGLALALFAGARDGAARETPATPRPTRTVEAVAVPLKPPLRPLAELEAALASADASARAAAAWELAGAGVVPESAGNKLKAAFLGDADPRVRIAAVWALGHLRQGVAQADGALQALPYDEPPRLVQQAKMSYPQRAFDEGVEGTVTIEFAVDEEGAVAHAEVRASVPELDDAALAAVRAWRFVPAKLEGKPVASMASTPVTFRIHPEK
jgi:TonB family protein